LDRLLRGRRRDRTFRSPSPYPPSSIDLAFVVPEDVAAADVAATLGAAAGDLPEDVRLFDVFRSDALGAGRKSLAFALRFRAPDHTLTDDEVGEIRRRCIDAVVGEHGAELRG
jgi:phenylalanyl-tRNA synthetase beta chain